jgi:hypothetical protein
MMAEAGRDPVAVLERDLLEFWGDLTTPRVVQMPIAFKVGHC